METILAALLTLAGTAIGWALFLAYRAGVILAAILQRLDNHEHRLTAIERARLKAGLSACPSSTETR